MKAYRGLPVGVLEAFQRDARDRNWTHYIRPEEMRDDGEFRADLLTVLDGAVVALFEIAFALRRIAVGGDDGVGGDG